MRVFAVGQEGSRDPSATADGRRVVNCPAKHGEPIAAGRCVEAQAEGCFCPGAHGALAGAEEALDLVPLPHQGDAGQAEAAARRQQQAEQLHVLKKRAADLGMGYAGPAAILRRGAIPQPVVAVPPYAPPRQTFGRECKAGCGTPVRRRNGKLDDTCAACRQKAAKTPWRPCSRSAEGCKGRIRPDNKTGLCRLCVHGIVKHIAPPKMCSTNCGRTLQANSVGDKCFACRTLAGETSRNKARDDYRREQHTDANRPSTAAEVKTNTSLSRMTTKALASLLIDVKREIELRNRTAGSVR